MQHDTDSCYDDGAPLAAPPLEISATLSVIGGKWKLLILWQLHRRDCRFNEIMRAIPGATQHMLTTQLRELEAHGVITRTVFAQVPPKVVYALTEHGRSLDPVLANLFHWGATHLERRQPQGA